MRAALFLAAPPWSSVVEQLELAELADNLGLDALWADADSGHDGACLLGLLAGRTRRIGLGCTDPAATGRAAATLGELAAARLRTEPLDRGSIVAVAVGENGRDARAAVAAWPAVGARPATDETADETADATADVIATTPAGLDAELARRAAAGTETLIAVPCGSDRRAVVRALAAATETL